MKWEYLIRRYGTIQERDASLKVLGEEGWELVAVDGAGYEFYFKRRFA